MSSATFWFIAAIIFFVILIVILVLSSFLFWCPTPSSSFSSSCDPLKDNLRYTMTTSSSSSSVSISSSVSSFLFTKSTNSTSIKRLAFCIGIDYIGTTYALHSCGNDMNQVGEFCKGQLGIPASSIYFMTDRTTAIPSWNVNTTFSPTISQLQTAFTTLLQQLDPSQPCEIFWFYSGHGTNFSSATSTETDQQDEYIVMKDGYVKDNVLHLSFIQLLPSYASLFCLFDCCFSGTATDLRYIYDPQQNQTFLDEKHNFESASIVMLSASTDHQVAYGGSSTTELSVFTRVFLEQFRKSISFVTLRQNIQSAFVYQAIPQTPVLTASKPQLFSWGLVSL